MITLAIIAGYVLLGIGTARHVAGAMRRYMMDNSTISYWDFGDVEILVPTVLGGLFWPLAWVWLLIIRPVVKVVGPGITSWWLAPYRKAARR